MALISVVVPTYSRLDLLNDCVDSILAQTVDDIDIIVVDNASTSHISDSIRHRFGERVTTVRLDRNTFFCGAVNRGASIAEGTYLAVINDDCWLEPDWAAAALETFERFPEASSVASLVLKAADPKVIDSAGDHLDISGRATNRLWGQEITEANLGVMPVFSPAGSCAIYRRDLFNLAGMFDEDFVAYVDDIDLGFRLQLLDYRTIFNPACRAYHTGGGTDKTRRYAAYLLERNMTWNIVKNFPTELIRRHLPQIVRAQSVPAPLVDGISVAGWLHGKMAGLAGICTMLRKRRQIQRLRRIAIDDLESMLLSHPVRRCHL